jgi:hypothetical protein
MVFGNSLSAGTPTDATVTTAKLAADAVTAAKIADDAISDEHLDPTVITGQTAETSIADDDLILISDTSASAALKKMTKANFVSGLGGGGYTQATAVSASGTTVSFTGIPSGTNNIIITAENLSMSGSSSNFHYQIGDSGGIETSGYSSIDFFRGHSAGDMGTVTSTSGFILAYSFAAADVWSGNIFLQRISGNKWVSTYTAQDITEYWRSGTGHKELSGELTQLQFSWVGGNSFDGGSVNIQYQ